MCLSEETPKPSQNENTWKSGLNFATFFSALVTERHLNESQPRDASPCDWHRGRTASAVSDAGARGTVVDSLSGVVFFLGRKFSSLLPRTEAITPVPLPTVVPPSVKKCLSLRECLEKGKGGEM